jgi:SAM-dependent methyltransferase
VPESSESPLGWAERVYSAAADHFTRPALAFWETTGEETVRRAGVSPGDRVLDLCCGAGASLLPEARAVGPSGSVVGVDIAGPILALARQRLDAAGATGVDLVQADAMATGYPDASFDAVVCVFGVFFVPDMPGFVREMWRMVRPGGRIAITTWGPDVWEPGTGIFWDSVRELRPELRRAVNPWDEITTPDALATLMAAGGVDQPDAVAVPGTQPLEQPEDFWDVVLGSAYRGTVDVMEPPEREALKAAVLDAVRRAQVTEIRTDVVVGTATKPPG